MQATYRDIERCGRIQSALQRKQQPHTSKDLWALARHWAARFEATGDQAARHRAERYEAEARALGQGQGLGVRP